MTQWDIETESALHLIVHLGSVRAAVASGLNICLILPAEAVPKGDQATIQASRGQA